MAKRFAVLVGIVCALGAVLAAATPSHAAPYGINAHVPDAARLDRAAEAGIGWIRCDFNWTMLEPAQDQFDWAIFDQLVAQANARGLSIYATIAYTPSWANGGQGGNVPPSNPADWYDAVFKIVSRYKSSVHHWGMWNEPNLGDFWSGTRTQYIQDILVNGAAAVKSADPTALVAGPDLAHLNSGKWDQWLRDVLLQAGGSLDIVTHHQYSDDAYGTLDALDGPLNVASVKKIIDSNGGGSKPFWLTETGWTSNDVGEPDQADFFLELLDGMNARSWWQRTFFYELMDDPNITSKWGILRSDLSAKESYGAYADLIALRPNGGRAALPAGSATWEAESQLNHQVGHADGSAWTATPALDSQGYLAFGPYTTGLPGGLVLEARFRLRSSVAGSAATVARVEVNDAARSNVLVQHNVLASEFPSAGSWIDVAVQFTPLTTHAIELRTYFTDVAEVSLDRVTVVETGLRPGPPAPAGCGRVGDVGAGAAPVDATPWLAALALATARAGRPRRSRAMRATLRCAA